MSSIRIDQDRVPSTVEQAVDMLIESFDEEAIATISGNLFEPCHVHFGAGRMIRNAWSLWNLDSPIKRDAVTKYGIAHSDDISGLIWDWAFAKIRKQPFDPAQAVNVYHEHWKRMGTDSLKAGGWPP